MDTNGGLPASFTADLLQCSALPHLTDKEVTGLFMATLDRAGGTIVEAVSRAFPNTGLTCVLILRESDVLAKVVTTGAKGKRKLAGATA